VNAIIVVALLVVAFTCRDSMPPNGAKPTLEERQRLAEWITYDAP
jgi:hypothetical protein